MEVNVIESLDSIIELKHKWNCLHEKAKSNLFCHHTWVYENIRCFNTKDILLLVVYDDKKVLIGIFPFAIKTIQIKWWEFRVLTHAVSNVTDYSQFIIDPNANSRLMIKRVLEKLIKLQNGRWDIFKVDNLNDSNDISNMFKSMMLRTLYAGVTATEITPIIKYECGYEEAKKTSNIKRRFRKLAENSIVTHVSGVNISDVMLKKISQLHKLSYPSASFDNNQSQKFYRALIHDSNINHKIYFSYVTHKEQIIAAHFGFMDANTFYYYVPTYDEKFANYGPGQILLWKLIGMAKEKGILEFDFLRGSEVYKFDWANKINTNYTVIGVTQDSNYFTKLIINLWLITKALPFFNREPNG
jgi:CelD/BcsL family acetyltransferase involved in cellulose biosynthesis